MEGAGADHQLENKQTMGHCLHTQLTGSRGKQGMLQLPRTWSASCPNQCVPASSIQHAVGTVYTLVQTHPPPKLFLSYSVKSTLLSFPPLSSLLPPPSLCLLLPTSPSLPPIFSLPPSLLSPSPFNPLPSSSHPPPFSLPLISFRKPRTSHTPIQERGMKETSPAPTTVWYNHPQGASPSKRAEGYTAKGTERGQQSKGGRKVNQAGSHLSLHAWVTT